MFSERNTEDDDEEEEGEGEVKVIVNTIFSYNNAQTHRQDTNESKNEVDMLVYLDVWMRFLFHLIRQSSMIDHQRSDHDIDCIVVQRDKRKETTNCHHHEQRRFPLA